MQECTLFVAQKPADYIGFLDRAHQLINASVVAEALAVKVPNYTPNRWATGVKAFVTFFAQ